MKSNNIKKIKLNMVNIVPSEANGAERADIFVRLAIEMGLTHLLVPEALPTEVDLIELPEEAPELYQARSDRSEKPPMFIKRVYADWLGQGLARHHLLQLDEALYMALANWLKKNELPEDLDLPTKKEIADRELTRLGLQEGDTLPYPSYYRGLKDKLRLYNAARNRK